MQMVSDRSSRPTVVLVNPRMCSPRSARMPLSLLALASVLDDGYEVEIVDGNVGEHARDAVLAICSSRASVAAVGVTVMPGPQVGPAIEVSADVRAAYPAVPIVWGGFFPTLYPEAAINASYVDFVARGQGEKTLLELLEKLADDETVADVPGLTWKRGGEIVHNPVRAFVAPDAYPQFPYRLLPDLEPYIRPSFLGSRTTVHQAAIGCRYRCSFCGVASMFGGSTALPGTTRLERDLETIVRRHGANAVQFYDHNFFDREETSVEALEVIAGFDINWWCYARTEALAGFSSRTWDLIRKSGLRMTFLGAEAASDTVLKGMRKGARVEHTMEVAGRCRENGVIPEFSFVLGGPEDPDGEVERTFAYIKRLKKVYPECEVILYFYSPTPQRDLEAGRSNPDAAVVPTLERYGPDGPPLPTSPEGWTEPRWVDYACHRDAPWISPKTRRRVRGFARVLGCRFPTLQDHSTPEWGKWLLRGLASWRYAGGRWERPWELDLARKLIPLREPERESI